MFHREFISFFLRIFRTRKSLIQNKTTTTTQKKKKNNKKKWKKKTPKYTTEVAVKRRTRNQTNVQLI